MGSAVVVLSAFTKEELMKRILTTLLCLGLATPVLAQEEGFCMTQCKIAAGQSAATFTCEDTKVSSRLNEQRIPNQAIESPPQLGVLISERNPEMGNNTIFPGQTRIFYPCGLP